MPLVPYGVLRPFLFGMDPEAAHDLTLRLIEHTQHNVLRHAYAQARVHDPVTLAGLQLPNRVGLAAGLDKNARCIAGWDAMGFGFVELGTVTPLAQAGNPKPRMFRLPQAQALINRFGFNNQGLEPFLAKVAAARRISRRSLVMGLNIGKNAATPIEHASADYLACLAAVYPHADYVAVNISSPNTQGLRGLQSEDALAHLLESLAEVRQQLAQAQGRRVPIFVKIAPDLDGTQVQAIATHLLRYGMDGAIATNTTLERQAVAHLPHGAQAGGLSGVPVRAASTRVIAALRQSTGADFPIIGVGGVFSGADAQEKIAAGAHAVQIYSGLIYRGPGLVGEIAHALAKTGYARKN
jgi:dihydroorotate dehydrogenase